MEEEVQRSEESNPSFKDKVKGVIHHFGGAVALGAVTVPVGVCAVAVTTASIIGGGVASIATTTIVGLAVSNGLVAASTVATVLIIGASIRDRVSAYKDIIGEKAKAMPRMLGLAFGVSVPILSGIEVGHFVQNSSLDNAGNFSNQNMALSSSSAGIDAQNAWRCETSSDAEKFIKAFNNAKVNNNIVTIDSRNANCSAHQAQAQLTPSVR